MNPRQLIPALVAAGFLATLGLIAWNGGLRSASATPPVPAAAQPSPPAQLPDPVAEPASMPAPAPVTAQDTAPSQPPPAEPDPESDRQGTDPDATATYADQSAARDRAAAHGARSR